MKISQDHVNSLCLELCGSLLKTQYKNKWKSSNPTYGYCYVVSEAIFHFDNQDDLKPYYINFGEDLGTHWFLANDEIIVDLTGNQFDFDIDYSIGRRGTFLKGGIKTGKGFISKRGYEIAKKLKLVKE